MKYIKLVLIYVILAFGCKSNKIVVLFAYDDNFPVINDKTESYFLNKTADIMMKLHNIDLDYIKILKVDIKEVININQQCRFNRSNLNRDNVSSDLMLSLKDTSEKDKLIYINENNIILPKNSGESINNMIIERYFQMNDKLKYQLSKYYTGNFVSLLCDWIGSLESINRKYKPKVLIITNVPIFDDYYGSLSLHTILRGGLIYGYTSDKYDICIVSYFPLLVSSNNDIVIRQTYDDINNLGLILTYLNLHEINHMLFKYKDKFTDNKDIMYPIPMFEAEKWAEEKNY